jgi:hypothetical protein
MKSQQRPWPTVLVGPLQYWPMAVQSLANGVGISSSFNLSIFSLLGWDVGTTELLQGLFFDAGLIEQPISVVPNCSALQSPFAGAPAAAGSPTSGQQFGVLDRLFDYCVNSAVVREDSTDAIDDNLYCTWGNVRRYSRDVWHACWQTSDARLFAVAGLQWCNVDCDSLGVEPRMAWCYMRTFFLRTFGSLCCI